MTDRELLEAAARAAGIPLQRLEPETVWDTGQITRNGWNPLTDDSDALRLAVALALEIRPGVGMVTAAGDGVWEEVTTSSCTREEAKRRAIVLAAAKHRKPTPTQRPATEV